MYTTADERGVLNNFANEPKKSYATPPSTAQQRSYVIQGVLATLFVTALVVVSVAVS